MVTTTEKVFASILICHDIAETREGGWTLTEVIPDPIEHAPKGKHSVFKLAVFVAVVFKNPKPTAHTFEISTGLEDGSKTTRVNLKGPRTVAHMRTYFLRGEGPVVAGAQPTVITLYVDGVERAIAIARTLPPRAVRAAKPSP